MVGEDARGLDVEAVLDAVESWHAERTERDIAIFVAAAHFADLHHPDSQTPHARSALAGMERAVRLGGSGTPLVLEFAAAELGPRIGRSPYSARSMIADALDVRHRLPRLWARVCAGQVPVGLARHVAQQTRELSQGGAALVDAGVVEYADGRLSWSRSSAWWRRRSSRQTPTRPPSANASPQRKSSPRSAVPTHTAGARST